MDVESMKNALYLSCPEHSLNERSLVCLQPSCVSKCFICRACAQNSHSDHLHAIESVDDFLSGTLNILSCNSQNPNKQFLQSLNRSRGAILLKIAQLQNIMSALISKLRRAVKSQFQTFIQSFQPTTAPRERSNLLSNLNEAKMIYTVYQIQVLKRNQFENDPHKVVEVQNKYVAYLDSFMTDFVAATSVFENLKFVSDLRFSNNALNRKVAELKMKGLLNPQKQTTSVKAEQKLKYVKTNKNNPIPLDQSESQDQRQPRSREKIIKHVETGMPKNKEPTDRTRRIDGDSIRDALKKLQNKPNSWKKVSENNEIKFTEKPQVITSPSHSQVPIQNHPETQFKPQENAVTSDIVIEFRNKNFEQGHKKQGEKKTQSRQQTIFARPERTFSPEKKKEENQEFFPMKIKVPLVNLIKTGRKLVTQQKKEDKKKPNQNFNNADKEKTSAEQSPPNIPNQKPQNSVPQPPTAPVSQPTPVEKPKDPRPRAKTNKILTPNQNASKKQTTTNEKPAQFKSRVLSHRSDPKKPQVFEYLWEYDGKPEWKSEKFLIHIDQWPSIQQYWRSLKLLNKK